jgi:hypothetical protein
MCGKGSRDVLLQHRLLSCLFPAGQQTTCIRVYEHGYPSVFVRMRGIAWVLALGREGQEWVLRRCPVFGSSNLALATLSSWQGDLPI